MNTEEIGINYLESILLENEYLSPNITTNDKTITWDGDIQVNAKAGSNKKKDLLGRIPIQVKSRSNKSIKKDIIKFDVSLSDLENFQKDSGAIYFIVYISKKKTKKIYYRTFLHLDLARILNENKNEDTIRLEFQKFPEDQNKITELFFNFLNDEKLQKSTLYHDRVYIEDWEKDFDKFEKLRLFIVSLDPKKIIPFKELTSKSHYLYAEPKGIGKPIPIDKFDNLEIENTTPLTISSNNCDHYYDAHVKWKEGNLIIYRENSFEIEFEDFPEVNKKINVQFFFNGSLKKRLNDINFFCMLIKTNKFKLQGSEINLGKLSVEDKQYYFSQQKTLRNTLSKLTEFGVQKELDVDSLSTKDLEQLTFLLDNNKKTNKYKLDKENLLFAFFEIANIKLLLYIIRENESYTVKNYFSNKMDVIVKFPNKTEFKVSQFLLLKKSYLLADNFSADFIYNDIKKYEPNHFTIQQVNLFLLEVIKAYDDAVEKKEEYLSLCESLSNWLLQNYESGEALYFLNYCQIKIRKSEILAEKERKRLENIRDENNRVESREGRFFRQIHLPTLNLI
jgi:hypothetical protein